MIASASFEHGSETDFQENELFTGIDVSLTETTEQHAARLGAYIDYFQIQSGIIIFSDLISLEEL